MRIPVIHVHLSGYTEINMGFRRKKRKIFNNPARQIILTKPNPIRSFITSAHIFWEFFTGFMFIANFAKAVSFFGSAREGLPPRFYEECEDLAGRLTKKGFAVITGGSGGIMRAANKGAFRADGESVGINITLPKEQRANMFLKHSREYSFFFSRKIMLSCASEVYIFFPGGFGTLDELFEMLTTVQTRHSDLVPIILYGKDYWTPLISFIETKLQNEYLTIKPRDTKIYTLVDSVDEAEWYFDSLEITNPRTCKIGLSNLRKNK